MVKMPISYPDNAIFQQSKKLLSAEIQARKNNHFLFNLIDSLEPFLKGYARIRIFLVSEILKMFI